MSNIIKIIVVHMSYTRPSQDIGAKEIRDWHTSPDPNDPSKPWSDIGYHDVIRRDGTIEEGRPYNQQGAHVKGRNRNSLGVCLVGGRKENADEPEFNFTRKQMWALESYIRDRKRRFNDPNIRGHNDYAPDRACPGFNVREYFKR